MPQPTLTASPSWSLWRHPGVPSFCAAASLARLAEEMFSVAVVLLVLARTGSAALAGATVAAATLPSVVSGPLLGAWLDRTARRRLALALNQALLAAGLAGILLTAGRAPGFVVPALALVAGCTAPMLTGGFTSLIPALVPERLLPAANAVEAASFNLAAVAGPALAGATVAAAGPDAAVGLQAALALAGLVLIAGVPARAPAGNPTRSLAATVRAGLVQLSRTPVLRGVTLTTTVAMGAQGLLALAFPFFAAELGAGRGAAGYLWAAFALGSAAGALGAAGVQVRWPAERVVGAGVALLGLGMLAWPLAGSLPAALVLVGLAGLADGPAFAATFAVRQRWSPPNLRGQIFTTAASLKIGAFALGAAAGGPLVSRLGARPVLALVGAAQLAAVAAGWLAGLRLTTAAR